jgi:hypothetical protein
VKDKNSKVLKRDHYTVLKELGIEIIMYSLKTHDNPCGFEIYGSLSEEVDFDELHDLLLLLKRARDSNSPAVKDLLERLRVVLRVSDDR